jgi:hypothetical protein
MRKLCNFLVVKATRQQKYPLFLKLVENYTNRLQYIFDMPLGSNDYSTVYKFKFVVIKDHLYGLVVRVRQSSWLQIQRFRVLFPALPDILRNSESGTGSTQSREYN